MKKYLYLIVVSTLFFACKKDNPSGNNNNNASIVGNWKILADTSREYSRLSTTVNFQLADTRTTAEWNYFIKFNDNGTGQMGEPAYPDNYTYKVNGDKLTLSFPGVPALNIASFDEEYTIVKLSANRLVLYSVITTPNNLFRETSITYYTRQ